MNKSLFTKGALALQFENRLLGTILAALVVLYVAAVIAFIIIY